MKIGSEVSGKHHEDVVETLKSLGGDKHCLDGAGRKKMWSLLKRKYPKMSPLLPVGKKNRNGKVITNHMGLKKLYLETYLHRIRKRPIKTEFQEIEKMKNNLFDLRLKNCKERKSKPWEMCHLDKVLKI